eukprot:Selendium_serpulae@DN10829_c0_g1_i1.p1
MNADEIVYSDPYAEFTLGEETFFTHVIKDDLNPSWNCVNKVSVAPGDIDQPITFRVWDEDPCDTRDNLGMVTVVPRDCVDGAPRWFNVGGDAELCLRFRYGGDTAEQLGLDNTESFARPTEEQLDLVIDEDGKPVDEAAPVDLE